MCQWNRLVAIHIFTNDCWKLGVPLFKRAELKLKTKQKCWGMSILVQLQLLVCYRFSIYLKVTCANANISQPRNCGSCTNAQPINQHWLRREKEISKGDHSFFYFIERIWIWVAIVHKYTTILSALLTHSHYTRHTLTQKKILKIIFFSIPFPFFFFFFLILLFFLVKLNLQVYYT